MVNFLLKMNEHGQVHSVVMQEGIEIMSGQYLHDIVDCPKEELSRYILEAKDLIQFYFVDLKNDLGTIGMYMIRFEDTITLLGLDVKGLTMAYIDTYTKWKMAFTQSYCEDDNNSNSTLEDINAYIEEKKKGIPRMNTMIRNMNESLLDKLYRDPQTGLISRYQYAYEMERRIADKPNKKGVFAYIHVNHFYDIEEKFGQDGSKIFLKELGKRILHIDGKETLKVRLTKDSVGLFLYGYEALSIDTFEFLWNEIQEQVLSKDFVIKDKTYKPELSVGMSIYGLKTKNVFEVIEEANLAMYRAKAQGNISYHVYSERMVNTDMTKDALTGIRNSVGYANYIDTLNNELKVNPRDVGLCLVKLYSAGIFGDNSEKQNIKRACTIVCQTFAHSPVFRINTTEFVAVLIDSDYKNRERLIKQIYRQNKVKLRLGVALWNEGDTDFNDLMDRARQDFKNRKDDYE